MNRPMFIGPAAAAVITGLSLFVSRAVLDQMPGVDGPIRFAFIPPWWHLPIDIVLGALLVFALERVRKHASRPLLALIVLVVPFLPWLPDRWPVLQMLSGPFTPMVWLVVSSIVVWWLWPSTGAAWRLNWPLPRMAIGIALATLIVCGAAAWRLTATNIFPGGDEPHYLVIAQSLWRDGDLKIENNHARGDYKEYFEADLKPHYHTRGVDGEIYSIHPIGMPVLMAPVYAAGGYPAVVLVLILMASIAAAIAWWWTAHALASPAAATFAWIAIACSGPFLFNSFTVYPEIVAALAVMIAMTLATRNLSIARSIAIGAACGALPWLSTKYAPMSAALLVVAAAREWKKEPASFLRNPKVWAIGIPYALALLAWFTFFYVYWGSPLPSAPYGSDSQTSARNVLMGVPGLLFDQEYGLLAYAPVFLFAATGLAAMWRAGAELRRRAIEIAFVFAALIAIVGAFDLWWGGSAAPARPIASGLLLLSLPIAMAFKSAPAPSIWRAAQLALLSVGIGVAITLAAAEGGFLIDNGRDGSSALLEYWSPRWPIWKLAPSFITRNSTGVDLAARSRLASLDAFDAGARPIGIRYSPLRFVPATELLPLLSLSVKPGQRTDPQPLRVIHNGRFSLPAGAYTIEVAFGDQVPGRPTPLQFQVGRQGPPFESRMIDPKPGEHTTFKLPLPADAAFVALRGPLEMERAITAITITPISVVDAGKRPSVPEVLTMVNYGGTFVIVHDPELVPEPAGFWTIGRRDARITLAVEPGRTMPTLRVHSGGGPNHATFRSGGWEQRLDMEPGRNYDVALPVDADGISTIEISTDNGFSPKQLDPASTDGRFLGIWIEVANN